MVTRMLLAGHLLGELSSFTCSLLTKMARFRLLDLPNIDRVFEAVQNCETLFALSLCSSKCQETIKTWVRTLDYSDSGHIYIVNQRTPIIECLFFPPFSTHWKIYSSRDLAVVNSKRQRTSGGWRFKNNGLEMEKLGSGEFYFVTDRLDELVVTMIDHLADLFDIPVRFMDMHLRRTRGLELYLGSKSIQKCEEIRMNSGSLPELSWILDTFRRLKIIHLNKVNPGPDFNHVICMDRFKFFEDHRQPHISFDGSLLAQMDCKRIDLQLHQISDNDINLFIKKWITAPYSSKLRSLDVLKLKSNTNNFGNISEMLEGVEYQDLEADRQKEFFRGDGARGVLTNDNPNRVVLYAIYPNLRRWSDSSGE